MKIVTGESVRQIDSRATKEFGISGLILMENAGRAFSNTVIQNYPECKEIAVLCGGGNNGGDGFVIARHLLSANRNVKTYLLSNRSKYTGDAKSNLEILEKIGADIKELNEKTSRIGNADLYIDAIFGTGLDREVKGFYRKAINHLNSKNKPVVSVDIPSGLASNTGIPLGTAVKADSTITFIKPKIGMCIHPGVEHTGKLFVASLSTPEVLEKDIKTDLLTFKECSALIRERDNNSHKGTFGHLFILGGSTGKSGAAVLTANAALRTGAGLVTLGVPQSINGIIEQNCTEAMSVPLEETDEGTISDSANELIHRVLNERKTAIAVGPGISTNEKTKNMVFDVVSESRIPMVLDADALNIISENTGIIRRIKTDVILTPHPGEMARLSGLSTVDIQNNRVETAREFAVNNRCILILKGARTVIASHDGDVYINPTGNPGMATGGMGDALTGIVSGLLTQGYSALNASIIGTFLHGYAGDLASQEIGQTGFTVRDLISFIPKSLNHIPHQEEKYFTIAN